MPAWGTAVVIPASLVLAVLLEHYVESPARKYLGSRPGQILHHQGELYERENEFGQPAAVEKAKAGQ